MYFIYSIMLFATIIRYSSLLRSELKFNWGAYSPSPLGRFAPKISFTNFSLDFVKPTKCISQNNLSSPSTDSIDIILCPLLVYSEFEQAKS